MCIQSVHPLYTNLGRNKWERSQCLFRRLRISFFSLKIPRDCVNEVFQDRETVGIICGNQRVALHIGSDHSWDVYRLQRGDDMFFHVHHVPHHLCLRY